MSYDRSKPLNSGMLKKDFKGEDTGGWKVQLERWNTTGSKKIQHDRNRIQGDARGAS